MKSSSFPGHRKAIILIAIAAVLGLMIVLTQSALRDLALKVFMDWTSEEVALPGGKISVRDLGKGGPTVVIVGALAAPKNGYWQLQRSIAKHTRVIAYDRPGIGESEQNSDPKTLPYIARTLRELLEARQLPPPYVLVGHSIGGHIIRYYAMQHPGEVAGLVILDQPHEDWFDYVRTNWSEEDAGRFFTWWQSMQSRLSGAAREEVAAYEENCDLIKGTPISQELPALMITGRSTQFFRERSPHREEDQARRAATQADLVAGVKDARHVVDWEVGHDPHRDKPEMVAGEIVALVERVRAGKGRDADGGVSGRSD